MTEDLELRPARPDDFDAVQDVASLAFAQEPDQEDRDVDRPLFEPERTLVVTDGDEIVATAGAFTRDLTVPGGIVPAAHVTLVGVSPGYRRRGLLTRMMRRQLADARALGEPVALLWASEGPIYQRFGYGLASTRLTIEADTRAVRLLPGVPVGTGRTRIAAPAASRKAMTELYERLRPERPGWSSRDERGWDYTMADFSGRRQGFTSQRVVLYEGADGLEGYAFWRTKGNWGSAGPCGEVRVRELVAATPEAYTALWRFAFSIDLTRTVWHYMIAPDEPLLYQVEEPSALSARLQHALWVRLLDVPAALRARSYRTGLDLVLDVADDLIADNASRGRLVVRAGEVTCEPTTDGPDLALDVATLGAAYLGGTSLTALAAAGRVRELRPGALAAASTAFGWHRAPQPLEIF